MATQTCWRCISRLLSQPKRPALALSAAVLPTTAAFSTTNVLSALNPPKAGQTGARVAQKGRRTLRLSKNKRDKDTRRRPEPGERKQLRKRIVLSNTNAFDVPGIEDLNDYNYALERSVGTIVGLPGPVLDSLRAIEAFKPSQGWGFFRKPTTLYREETADIGRHVKSLTGDGQPTTMRRIITGERGTGKSVLLVQAQSMAFMKGWVVIHLPNGQEITNATSSYAPLPDSTPQKFVQSTYIANLLGRIAKANEAILSSLSSQLTHNLSVPLQSNISLTRLAEMGARDTDLAWPVFQALWRELMAAPEQTGTDKRQRRPPVLLSLDGLAHVTKQSEYLTPNMHYIHAYDLLIVDHFISCLSGAMPLTNGGIVLGVDDFGNRPSVTSLDLAIAQSEAGTTSASAAENPFTLLPPGVSKSPSPPMLPSNTPTQQRIVLHNPSLPFLKTDPRVVSTLRNTDVTRLTGFSKAQAKTMLEYYARSGMMRQAVTDKLVAERWSLAGGGVVGELEKGGVRAAI